MIKINKSSNYFSALHKNHTKAVDFWSYSSAWTRVLKAVLY